MLVFVPLFVFVSVGQASGAGAMDFWVGNWTMDSSQPKDPKTKGAWQENLCTNRITRVYGGKVIQEAFKMPGFTGGSWTSFDPTKKIWRQTWVDDAGSYLLFEGGPSGSEVVLTQTNAAKGHARMRFANITKDSFDWLWESSSDGKKWSLNWHLRYRRDAKR
ncbi:MAG: DUF1579 domain-containing protein [Fimbriimonadaceae bacterium]|nr:DUF1579 domain-containing protein [Fimbriimonadaceae bacterium]